MRSWYEQADTAWPRPSLVTCSHSPELLNGPPKRKHSPSCFSHARRLSVCIFLAVTEILWLMFNASSSSIFLKMLKPHFLLSDFQFEASVKLEASPRPLVGPGNGDLHLPRTFNPFCSAQHKQPSQKILIYGAAQASCYFKPRAFQAAPCVPGQHSCLPPPPLYRQPRTYIMSGVG